MSIFNPQTKEINCKIVYYGPAMSGKTTSMQSLQANIKKKSNKTLHSIPTTERTLFFDFLALSSREKIKGYTTRFQVYTVPGQVLYENVRKVLLNGVDGIIFVADSRLEYLEDTIKSMNELKINLQKLEYNPSDIPMVIQYNKRDCKTAARVTDLSPILNDNHMPEFETIANKGKGVSEAFQEILRRVMVSLKEMN